MRSRPPWTSFGSFLLVVVAGCASDQPVRVSSAATPSSSQRHVDAPKLESPAPRIEANADSPSSAEEVKVYLSEIEQPQAPYSLSGTVLVRAAVRKQPTAAAEVLLRLEVGALVTVRLWDDNWYQVPLNGDDGFIRKRQVKLTVPPQADDGVADAQRAAPRSQEPAPSRVPQPAYGDSDRRPSTQAMSYPTPSTGVWIDDMNSEGSIITLSDGSIWKVDSYDVFDSSLWLALDDIIVEDSVRSVGGYILINTDQRETVGATFLGYR